jgi:hypothetical protein
MMMIQTKKEREIKQKTNKTTKELGHVEWDKRDELLFKT